MPTPTVKTGCSPPSWKWRGTTSPNRVPSPATCSSTMNKVMAMRERRSRRSKVVGIVLLLACGVVAGELGYVGEVAAVHGVACGEVEVGECQLASVLVDASADVGQSVEDGGAEVEAGRQVEDDPVVAV